MQSTIIVKGMNGVNCEANVRQVLEMIMGVHAVELHIDTGKVDITYDDVQVSINKIVDAIEDKGYQVIT